MLSHTNPTDSLLPLTPSESNQSAPELIQKPQKRHPGTLIAEGALGVLGLGAGALYIGPATFCARESDAGIWLSNLLSEKVAIGVFTAGGADYASINAYFSSKSVQSFYDYIKKQKTLGAKIGKTSVILIYTLTQEASLFLTSSITSAHTLETVVTVAGGAPGILYAGVGMMDYELPLLATKINQLATKMRNTVLDRFYSITPEEQIYRHNVIQYQKQYTNFLNHIDDNWRYIEAHASSLPMDGDATALARLFNNNIHAEPKSTWETMTHRLGQLLGLALTANYSAAFTLSTFRTLVPFIPSLPLQILLTAALSSSSTYGNIKIGMHGMTGLLDSILNLVRGKPIESLAFQLRPKTSAGVAVALLPASIFSYAVSDFLFLKQFPGKNEGLRRILRYTANASMSFYHLAGLFHFYVLVLSLVSKDKNEQSIFALEREVDKLKKMSLDEFIEFAKKNSDAENARYGITLPEDGGHIAEALPVAAQPVAITSPQTTVTSRFSSWCSWFKGKTPEKQPLLGDERQLEYEEVEDGFVLIK